MTAYPYQTLDVFTDTRFGGNPLAVVLDADGLSTAQMQAVAREFGYSETTFVCRATEPGCTHRVRIFTPTFEMPFAGHPNVGTAFALAAMDEGATGFRFQEIAGPVDVSVRRGSVLETEIAAPEPLSTGDGPSVADAAAALGLAAADVRTDRHGPTLASVGAPFTIVEVARAALDRAAARDEAGLRAMPGMDAIYAYARGEAPGGEGNGEALLHARMFFVTDGIVEDPATGSATAAAAALLASLDGTGRCTGRFTVRQGEAMGRASTIRVRVEDGRAFVSGTCVPVMRGTLEV